MSWQRPFDAVFDRWDRSSFLIQCLTFPLIVVIWVPYICVAIPQAFIYLATDRSEPPEIKEMVLYELRDWTERLVARFDGLQEVNPDGRDVLDPPHERSKTLLALLSDPSQTKECIHEVAKTTISEFSQLKGLPIAELVWLARHIEKWASQ